ncbi:MAG: ATP-binding protein [Clostridia bacterium]|nr:ATP-binding protein [Clostridia bacterium]
MKKMEISALSENTYKVIDFIDNELMAHDCDIKTKMQIELVVEEVFVNIASYAYSSQAGNAEITVEISENPKKIIIEFKDSGKKYNPLENQEADTTLPPEKRRIGGLGIFLVKKNTDNVYYQYKNNHNILTLEKLL